MKHETIKRLNEKFDELFEAAEADEVGLSSSNALLVDDFDYELDSKPPEDGGETLCGKLGRKHRMKRFGPMHTGCVYPGCDACQ